MSNKVHLVILNITSWCGLDASAAHLYGSLILCTNPQVTVDNAHEWNVKYLGAQIELVKIMTLENARKLDKKDGWESHHQRLWLSGQKETIRFNNFEEVVTAGVAKWKELGLYCPFISLYEGERYKKNSCSDDETVILYPDPEKQKS